MTRNVKLSRGNSPYMGQLPKGCRECMKGAKLVLFVTGKCTKECYYCPISEERRDHDGIFANEVEASNVEEALSEARLIDATGMGITGGEPLLELERTIQLIREFKKAFGETFHVHLYTGLEPLSVDVVKQLIKAGLDELRLHRFEVGKDYPKLRELTKGRIRLGIEIPVIPGELDSLKELLRQFDEIGIDFVNLNELEFTPLNTDELRRRNLKFDSDTIASAQQSEEEAIELVEWAATETTLNVHFCPLSLKDGVQLRNRFRRRAKNVAKPFEQISTEGLLVKGIIIPPSDISLKDSYTILLNEFQIPKGKLFVNHKQGRVETSPTIIRRLAKRLKDLSFQVGIAEEYPIASRFQVSYEPL